MDQHEHKSILISKYIREDGRSLLSCMDRSPSASASNKELARTLMEKLSNKYEEIEITYNEALSFVELYRELKKKNLFEGTLLEHFREQQVGAMASVVLPIASAFGLQIDDTDN